MGAPVCVVAIDGAARTRLELIKRELAEVWDALDALPVSPSTDPDRERATDLEEAVDAWEIKPPTERARAAMVNDVHALNLDVRRSLEAAMSVDKTLTCSICGAHVDPRNLAEAMFHAQNPHRPITPPTWGFAGTHHDQRLRSAARTLLARAADEGDTRGLVPLLHIVQEFRRETAWSGAVRRKRADGHLHP